MNFCLSDLVPPLRWSDAARIRTLTEPVERDGLPDAWWRSLPMARVLAVLSADRLAELLTELALEHWPAAAIGDILPALYVAGPDDADDPQVEIALDRAGSWAGLLALTGRELLDQPFIQARPMLTALFAAVFDPARRGAGDRRGAPRARGAGGAQAAGEPLPPAMFPPAGPAAFPPASSLDIQDRPNVQRGLPLPKLLNLTRQAVRHLLIELLERRLAHELPRRRIEPARC